MAMEFPTRPLVIVCTHAEEDGWYRSSLGMVFKVIGDFSVTCKTEAFWTVAPVSLRLVMMVRTYWVGTECQSCHGRCFSVHCG